MDRKDDWHLFTAKFVRFMTRPPTSVEAAQPSMVEWGGEEEREVCDKKDNDGRVTQNGRSRFSHAV